ncbi:MAG TPA: metallophosphoesterase [Marmoricola sp.]|nr:metallophosphoesterase [Marmoricola sp.]
MPAPPRRRLALVAVTVLAWLLVALPVAALTFVHSSRTTVIASHEAKIEPTFDGWAEVSLGPFLPSFRYPTGSRVGADIVLGKTSLTSYEELVRRYAFLAGQPDGQIKKVEGAIAEMAVEALVVGALVGLVGPGVWFALGSRRRHELTATTRDRLRTGATVAAVLALASVVASRPWDRTAEQLNGVAWQPLTDALPDVPIPADARPLQVDAGLLTEGTRRLVESALDSYRKSSSFYRAAAEEAAGLADELRQPHEDETVAVLVSDRHDNIGMDPVARAIADAGGATFLLDAGDDTSTGSRWEAFSLESLDEAFDDYDHRFHVAGNHDHGGFVVQQAEELGFTNLDAELVEGPDGIRLFGVNDPRSSGLGNWRDESGLSFDEVTQRVADAACEADEKGERIATLLLHDANNGDEALARGCVDLVAAGHLHVIQGPDRVEGANGAVGYSYTNGTTGGAAYAIAIGTKPRRNAVVSLVTYADGRPVGVQWVSLSPLGAFRVGDWTPLPRAAPTLTPRRDLVERQARE